MNSRVTSFKESAGLFGSLLELILLGRAAFVFPLSGYHLVGWVNAWSCLNSFGVQSGGDAKTSNEATLTIITITVVLFSTIVFGTATKPLINYLLPLQYMSTSSDASTLSPKYLLIPKSIYLS